GEQPAEAGEDPGSDGFGQAAHGACRTEHTPALFRGRPIIAVRAPRALDFEAELPGAPRYGFDVTKAISAVAGLPAWSWQLISSFPPTLFVLQMRGLPMGVTTVA